MNLEKVLAAIERYEAWIGRVGDRIGQRLSGLPLAQAYRQFRCPEHDWTGWEPLPEESVYTLGQVCRNCGKPKVWPG